MKQPLLSSSFKYKEQDPDYRGQPLQEQYANGPVQKRQCTDLICCLLFLAFIGGMAYIAYIGFTTGNPSLLASPFDQAQNQCKIDSGFQQYDKIFITTFENNLSRVTFICVRQCPTSNTSMISCHNNSIVSRCDQLVAYKSQTIVNVCLPSVDVNFDFQSFGNIGVLQQYFSDLRDARYLVLAMFGVAFVVSILYSLLMRCFAGCFIWTVIILFILFNLIIGASVLSLPYVEFLQKIMDYDSLPQNLKDRDYQIGAGSLCLTIAFLTLLIVCCMKRQIKISIGIIKASADFVRQCFSSYSLPIITSILQMVFLSFWVAVMLFLFSSNDDLDPVKNTPFAMVVWNENIQKFTIYYLFGLIWLIMFLDGLGLYLVSSTVAIWYFEEGSPRSPIIRSFCRSFKNSGSIVFGSLLLTIITVLRIVLQFISQKAKQSTIAMDPSQAAAVSFALKCANCLVACFQRIIRFLTQNAYIMMAVSGKNFCSSAKQSFYLMVRSTAQFAISHGTTKIFINIGKAFIIAICCVSGYIFITSIQPYKHQIYSPFFMTVIFAIVSFPIVYAFMELFEMAANTLLICYCIELDLVQRKSKCPNGLRNFLQQYVQSSSILNQQ